MRELFRAIPSTDKCLKALLYADPSLKDAPRPLLTKLVNEFWDNKRAEIKRGALKEGAGLESQLPALAAFVNEGLRPALRPVLNGAGVVIHTNLGRSVLAEEACQAVLRTARGYSSLELNLESGGRGSRDDIARGLIRQLAGAEDAIVVNNNAAAVLLILDSVCSGGETIVSRGELVEIGGSFRIPDIMLKGGTVLKEVGSTNRTRPEDYRAAVNERTRAIMRVHASNFRITGFHSSVDLKSLKELAKESGLPLIYDMGSGSPLSFEKYGLPPEPSPKEAIERGADLICFSGDKALGGPQAGIIAGRADLVEKCRKNPLARALRCDKLCLAALEATLRLYLDPEKARKRVPTAAMLSADPESLAKRARSLAASMRRSFAANGITCEIKLIKDTSRAGGGSYPERGLPTTLVCLRPEGMGARELRDRLLRGDPPLLGRLEKDAFCIDPRTIAKAERPAVVSAAARALSEK